MKEYDAFFVYDSSHGIGGGRTKLQWINMQ